MDISEAVLDFRVAPQPHLSRVVRDRVAEFAQSRGVRAEDLEHFLLALGEALANAIEHARAKDPIEIQVRLLPDRIVASVEDNGVGFRSGLAAGPDLPPPEAERGRGLPIMRRCCDIFALKSMPGRGTAVVIGRYLRVGAAGAREADANAPVGAA
jgi:anti-sigma regulatory factor (Ser/Thr protein kinase)